MRKDKQKRHARFVRLIEQFTSDQQTLDENVVEFEGFVWATLSQDKWSELLGVSDKTLRELAKILPIVSTKTQCNGKVIVLYRTGTKPHTSVRHTANVLAKIFRKKYGLKRIARHDYGCLCGLAEVWPDGVQVEIFKSVLRNFVEFRGGVKLAEPDSPYFERYYEFVPIRLVRKFHGIALEVYENELQATDKVPHAAIIALNPKKWISPITGQPFAVSGSIGDALKKKVPDVPSPPNKVVTTIIF